MSTRPRCVSTATTRPFSTTIRSTGRRTSTRPPRPAKRAATASLAFGAETWQPFGKSTPPTTAARRDDSGDLLDLLGAEDLALGHALVARDPLEERPPGVVVRGGPEVAVLLVAEFVPLVGEPAVEVEPVALDLELLVLPGRQVAVCPEADEAGARARGRLPDTVALEQEHVGDAGLEQVRRGRRSQDAPADDDCICALAIGTYAERKAQGTKRPYGAIAGWRPAR